jgi:DNA-binding IclR family transcriptional regulator
MSAARQGPAGRPEEPAEAAAGSRSVLRALEILDLLAVTQRPLGLAQIAKEFGIPKSSCLALMRALCARNFARQEPGGAYLLGLRTFEVGAAYLRTVTPVSAATPELRALTERLGMTSHFAVLEGDEVVYLAKQDPPGMGVRLASSLGARLSAWTTAVGKAQLAFSGERPAGAAGAARAAAPTAGQAAALEDVRRRGYAVDDGTTAAGIRCVAAPVFGVAGCCGAVGVSYLMHGEPGVPEIGDLLVSAARRVSAELGGARATEPQR